MFLFFKYIHALKKCRCKKINVLIIQLRLDLNVLSTIEEIIQIVPLECKGTTFSCLLCHANKKKRLDVRRCDGYSWTSINLGKCDGCINDDDDTVGLCRACSRQLEIILGTEAEAGDYEDRRAQKCRPSHPRALVLRLICDGADVGDGGCTV